jgi:hypothetical protein
MLFTIETEKSSYNQLFLVTKIDYKQQIFL